MNNSNHTNDIELVRRELVRVESESFGQEIRNRADGIVKEILHYFTAKTLAEISEAQMNEFLYPQNININADQKLYQLLVSRRHLSLAGLTWTPSRSW